MIPTTGISAAGYGGGTSLEAAAFGGTSFNPLAAEICYSSASQQQADAQYLQAWMTQYNVPSNGSTSTSAATAVAQAQQIAGTDGTTSTEGSSTEDSSDTTSTESSESKTESAETEEKKTENT